MNNGINEKVNAAIDELKESDIKVTDLFREFAERLEKINPINGGFEELNAIIELPEQQFCLIAPIFLDELEKSFNNPLDKMKLAKYAETANLRMEDIQEQYMEIIRLIDDELKAFSRQKRDFLKQTLGITLNVMLEATAAQNKIIQVPIEFCDENAKLPTYAHPTDSGLDVYAVENIDLPPGEKVLARTGLKVALPQGYEFQVRPKSGVSLKTSVRVANAPGTVDAGYREEICVILENIEPKIKDIEYEFTDDGKIEIRSILHGKTFHFDKGEKIAQLVLMQVPRANFYEVESVRAIGEDRKGGFGSTGKF